MMYFQIPHNRVILVAHGEECHDGNMRHKSSTEKARILVKHERSGLSLQQFAMQHGIAFSTLQLWARKAGIVAAHKNCAKLVEVPRNGPRNSDSELS